MISSHVCFCSSFSLELHLITHVHCAQDDRLGFAQICFGHFEFCEVDNLRFQDTLSVRGCMSSLKVPSSTSLHEHIVIFSSSTRGFNDKEGQLNTSFEKIPAQEQVLTARTPANATSLSAPASSSAHVKTDLNRSVIVWVMGSDFLSPSTTRGWSSVRMLQSGGIPTSRQLSKFDGDHLPLWWSAQESATLRSCSWGRQ